MGPMAETEVLAFMTKQQPFQKQDTIRLLKDIGTQQSVPDLQALVASNDIILRPLAQEALDAIMKRSKK
jgi:hypothetical protein